METQRGWPDEEPTEHQDGKPDTAVVPYVRALNEQGVTTLQSCAGHDDGGTKTDGTLWLGPEAINEDQAQVLAEHPRVTEVCRRYCREDCWEIGFPGMAEGEQSLVEAMDAVFAAAGALTPDSPLGNGDTIPERLEKANTDGTTDTDAVREALGLATEGP